MTIRADASLSLVTSLQLIIGVLMTLAALMISFIRGTPRVTFMEATPAKWKVLSVIWVPGSPIDCAPTAPTVEPAGDKPRVKYVIGHKLHTWFDPGFDVFDPRKFKESLQLVLRDLGFVIHDSLVSD